MKRQTKEFIAGPIPWDIFCKTSKSSKGALVAFIILSHLKKLTMSNEFRVQPSKFKQAGIPRNTAYKGIQELADMGLLKIIDKHKGRAYSVNVEGFCGEKEPNSQNPHAASLLRGPDGV